MEELDFIFIVMTSKYVAYQVKTWLLWWIKMYVVWRKGIKVEPFCSSSIGLGLGNQGFRVV